jgi:dephospho-CoA kinase
VTGLKIFIIVGMPAAGKNIAKDYAISRGIPYFATGDLVRAEVVKRGLEATPENMAKVSTELRGDDGMGVTRIAMSSAVKAGTSVVMIEGMRSWPEIELIRQKASAVVVAFLAPLSLRRERIISRGRSDDSADGFAGRDKREIAYGASVPIALADEYILNTKTPADAMASLDAIVAKYL